MADASNVQTDFRGGEWSQAAQGRMEDPEYRRALNICLNAFPKEDGSWTRRSGTRRLSYTAGGQYAWLIPFHFAENAPYVMELTALGLRFFSGPGLVLTSDVQVVSSVSTADPCVVTTALAHGWSTGDVVQFLVGPNSDSSGAGLVALQQYAITRLSSTTFSLADPVTGTGLDGSTFTVPNGTSIGRVLFLTTTYTEQQLNQIRAVQTEQLTNNVLLGNVVLLHNAVAPQTVVNSTPDSGTLFAQFTIGAATFKDGPYFDPVAGSVSASAVSGTITLSSAPANTFVSTDVGRLVRLFSEPGAWASGTAYTAGNAVKYTDGNYYTALASSTGNAPNQYPTLWAITPTAAVWAWGTIASYVSGTSVTVALDASQALLYTGTINTWRLGVYSVTTGYPTNGIFHEGRLWLAGSQGNRIDASNSDDPFNFSPTAVDGTVGDANAISVIFNSDDVNPVLWMTPDQGGILCGTQGGEWLISASALNDPLTPTSIQAHRITKYKCANVPPVRAGLGLLFVQAQGKRLMEYSIDVFSGRPLGRNLSEKAQHLTGAGIVQLAYQQDLVPIVWALMGDGSLAGMTYKRERAFASEPPTFAAWHRHILASGSTIESIATGPSMDGTLETLTLSVLDSSGKRHVEMMADTFQETDSVNKAWFLDGGVVPSGLKIDTVNNHVVMYGFVPYIGQSISVFMAGTDLGSFTVAADGSITVPFTSTFTDAYLQTYIGASNTPYDVQAARIVTVPSATYSIQSYLDNSIVTNTTLGEYVFDPVGNRFFEFYSGGSGVQGIKVFNLDTGAFIGATTYAALDMSAKNIKGYVPNDSIFIGGPSCIDGHGYLCMVSGNSDYLVKINISNPSAMTVQSLLKISGDLTDVTDICAFSAGDQDYLALTSVDYGHLMIVQTNSHMSSSYPGYLLKVTTYGMADSSLYGAGFVCTGAETINGKSSIGRAFALNFHRISATNSISLYSIVLPQQNKSSKLPSPTITLIATITPANIDATWTNISGVAGLVYDKTDGNLIIGVSTTDSVTNQSYVIKLNSSTGAVVWQTANDSSIPGNASNCQYSQLMWLDSHTLYVCNTSTGSITSSVLTGVTRTSAQCTDDSNSALYYAGNFISGGGAPTPLNGTVSGTGWFRLLGIGSSQTAATQLFGIPNVPACAGFAFTSQGQVVRPVSEQATGAKNGPGFGKTRRNQRAAFQLVKAQGVSIGTQFVDLTKVRTLVLKSDTVNVNAANALFTGIARQEIDDDNTFDGMIAWQITRPYPCIVSAVGGFLHTQDI